MRPFFRFTALLAVLCVLALGIFAASPELHAKLHQTDASHAVPVDGADHVCAVTLFAKGALAPGIGLGNSRRQLGFADGDQLHSLRISSGGRGSLVNSCGDFRELVVYLVHIVINDH